MRKDAIYARQSVDKKDSVSIETQIEKCEVIADKDSFIFKDKGYSGKNTDRPDLAKLISDIKEDKVRLYDHNDRFIGIYQYDRKNLLYKPIKIFME